MHVIIIAGIVLIISFLWMSNSIRNQPPVTSQSWTGLIKRMIHRHIIAIPLIIIILILLLISFKLWGILIDTVFISLEVWRSYKIIIHHQEQHAYIQSLTPYYNCYYSKIWLSSSDNHKLGGHNMHYMFICPKTKLITFPESKYGNQRKYRLIEIHFKPKYGPNYLRLTHDGKDYTRKSLFNKNNQNLIDVSHQGKIIEIPAIATIILESKNKNRPIKIHLHDEIIGKVHKLKQNCLNRLNHHQGLRSGLA